MTDSTTRLPVRELIVQALRAEPGDKPDRALLHAADAVLARLHAGGYTVVEDDPRHLLQFTDSGWTLQHSLTCRLDGRLFDCPVNTAVSAWLRDDGDPRMRGLFHVDVDDHGDVVLLGQVSP